MGLLSSKEAVEGECAIHKNTIEQNQLDTSIMNMLRKFSLDTIGLAEIKK